MHFHYVLAISLVCMLRNSVDSASGLKTSYKRIKIVAIWQHYKRVFSIFSPRIRRNGYLGTSYQKIWPRHSLRRLRCPIRQMHFQYRVTFTTHMPFYVFCYYVAWPCDLDLWPIVFDIVSCTIPPLSDPHANFNYPIQLSFTELRVLNIWSDFRYLKQSLRMRRVRWSLTGGKKSTFLKSLTPICLFSLSLSRRYNED